MFHNNLLRNEFCYVLYEQFIVLVILYSYI